MDGRAADFRHHLVRLVIVETEEKNGLVRLAGNDVMPAITCPRAGRDGQFADAESGTVGNTRFKVDA